MNLSTKAIKWATAAVVAAAMSCAATSCHSSRQTAATSKSGYVAPRRETVEQMRHKAVDRDFESNSIKKLVEEASRWIGTPYRYAGASTDGTDCSGLVMTVFNKVLDVKLPRNSAKQQQACHQIDLDKAQPGDLVFFATGSDRGRVSHVGLYIGGGEMIHASSRGVIVSNLSEKYYARRFHSAGRVDIVDKIYADSRKRNKKRENKTVDAPASAIPATINTPSTTSPDKPSPDVPEISLEDFIKQNPPAPLPEIDLDAAITSTVDSIFNSFMD